MKKKLALVTGGLSGEAQISYKSAITVGNNLDRDLFDVYKIDINPEGWWYENGKLQQEGYYINGLHDGKWTAWWENGNKKSETIYKDDLEVELTEWSKNGKEKGSCWFIC